jgi:hypothetical protein
VTVSAEQGTADGAAAATAIALVFAMRMRHALLGAATVARHGQQRWAGHNDFFETMTTGANGYDWEKDAQTLGGDNAGATRRDYLSNFQASLESGLAAPRDAGQMLRELGANVNDTSHERVSDDPIFRWIDELAALQRRNLVEEEALQAARRRDVERHVFPGWLLPPVPEGGRLERSTVSRDFPMRCEKSGAAFVASVSKRETGRLVFRAEFPTKQEAESAAWGYALLRSIIANRAEYRSLNESLSSREHTSDTLRGTELGHLFGPHGADGVEQLRRLADRSDRLRRGGGIGDFTDDQAWQAVLDGDANRLLARFPKPPFQGSLGPF